MKSPFQPYPTTRGPLKLLLYGDPGTLKTRRALALPGPRFMVDLEKGADEYGDLAAEGDQYLACQSAEALSEALDYLDTLRAGAVGTLIVDPITVVWSALQAAHAERMATKKKIAPEEAIFDQGVWSRLNRTHGDIVTRLLNAPYHVVMIARGKELRDSKGEAVIGYSYEGHKSLEFLAKTVVQSRRAGDLVLKDRTGTWPEGHKAQRLDLRELLARSGTGGARLETSSDAARRDASTPQRSDTSSSPRSSTPAHREPSSPTSSGSTGGQSEGTQERWSEEERRSFFRDFTAAWPTPWGEDDKGPRPPRYDHLAAWCEAHGHKRPSGMSPKKRGELIATIRDNPAKREAIAAWVLRQIRAETETVEALEPGSDLEEVTGG